MPIKKRSNSAVHEDLCDVLVLGAGASGLMCALTAAQAGARVSLLDHASKAGVQDYVSAQADFCGPALQAFSPARMLEWWKQHHLMWEERDHGRLFGLHSAEAFIDELGREIKQAGVTRHMRCRVDKAQAIAADTPFFHVQCTLLDAEGQETDHSTYTAQRLVLALGSPAWPQAGATDTGLRLAKSFGHSICPVRPVLVPLTMPTNWSLQGLAGISVAVEISADNHSFTDALLFTHQGISGPATLLASCHWRPGMPLTVNFLPEQSFVALLDAPECGKLLVKNLLSRHLPQRLVEALLPIDLAQRKVAELSRKHRLLLAQSVHVHTVVPTGTGGMRKAEAAAGGVNVAEINPHTLESQKIPGLYFTGEVLDVAGHLGGYNLHWAFASGALAGVCAGRQ
ncbi:MAG: aminoacetone oxidase family FAD-binding enzyme [Desulfovibrionaceae bacterium]